MIFFRAESMTVVGDMLSQIATNFHASVFPQFIEGYPLIVAAMVTGLVLHFYNIKQVCEILTHKEP